MWVCRFVIGGRLGEEENGAALGRMEEEAGFGVFAGRAGSADDAAVAVGEVLWRLVWAAGAITDIAMIPVYGKAEAGAELKELAEVLGGEAGGLMLGFKHLACEGEDVAG